MHKIVKQKQQAMQQADSVELTFQCRAVTWVAHDTAEKEATNFCSTIMYSCTPIKKYCKRASKPMLPPDLYQFYI